MSDYIDSLEFYLSNNMESKEQAKDLSNNVSNVSDEQISKDFSSTWLKIKEQNLIQIGEVAKRQYSENPFEYLEIIWNQLIGLRNRITHYYDGLFVDIIYETIKVSIPHL
jgi:uncharacterized protein with HEPN domain